jgi:hypothetical protein
MFRTNVSRLKLLGAVPQLHHSSWWRSVFWFVVWRCQIQIPAGTTIYLDMYFAQSVHSNTGIVPKIRPRLFPSTFLPIHYSLMSYHLIAYCQRYSQHRETNRNWEAYPYYRSNWQVRALFFRDVQGNLPSACSPIILSTVPWAGVKEGDLSEDLVNSDMEIGDTIVLSAGHRHELSSPARTLGSWVRIPLRALMFGVCVCVYSVFVLSFVEVKALRRADHSSKESYCLWKLITEMNKRPVPWMCWKSHWK